MTIPGIGPIAPVSRRAIAYLIDAVIAGLLCGIGYGIVLGATLGGGVTDVATALAGMALGISVVGLVMLVWTLVYTFMQGGGGSIGMRIMKLQLVREDGSAPLGFGRALLRNLVFGLSAAIIVGYFTPLFDGSGRFQGWHDKAGGALMRDLRDAAATAPSVAEVGPSLPSSPPRTLATAPGVGAVVPSAPASAQVVPPRPPLPSAPAASAPVAPASTPVAPASPQPALASAPDGLIDMVPGITVTSPPAVPAAPATPPAPAAPVVAPATPVAAPASAPEASAVPETPAPQVFEPSALDDDLESTRISIPGHRLVFIWDDGVRVRVSRRTVFGRNPASEDGATIVAVRDETLSLSKTHFEAAAESSGAWVLDRYSTNGVTIVRDGARIACPPGTRVPVRIGDALEIGDRIVTIGGYE